MTYLNKQKRNKILKKQETLMINSKKCRYLNKIFTFAAVTKKEIINMSKDTANLLNVRC